jgi:hypothetical protein
MGFRQVGFLKTQTTDLTAQQIRQTFKGHDADIALQARAKGQVTEIMTSPGESAFAELELLFGNQMIELRTILEDGTIVETSTPLSRLPERNDPVKTIRSLLEPAPLQKFLDWVTGNPSWTVGNCPRAGYYLELIRATSPQDLWIRHRQRVEDIAQHSECRMPSQNTMRLYLAICKRMRQIGEYRVKFIKFVENALGLVFALSIVSFVLSSCLMQATVLQIVRQNPVFIPGLVAFFVLFPLFTLAWPWRIGPWLMRQLPWPRRQPLDRLLQEEATIEPAFPKETDGQALLDMVMRVEELRMTLRKQDKRPSKSKQRHRAATQQRRRDRQYMLNVYQRYERLRILSITYG